MQKEMEEMRGTAWMRLWLFLIAVIALVAGVAYAFALAVHAADAEPVISDVVSAPMDTTALITWATDEPASSQVMYGTTTPYTASTTLDSGLVTSHSVAIVDLDPNTIYHFAVMSSDSLGSSTQSIDETFTTASSSATSTATSTSGTATTTVATTTPFVTLSFFSGMPGDTVMATGTGFTPLENLTLNFNGSMSSTSADTGGSFSDLLIVPSGSGSVPITVTGDTSGAVAANTFFIEPISTTSTSTTGIGGVGTTTTGTTTPSSDVITMLQNDITELQNQITLIEEQIAAILGLGGGVGTPLPPVSTTTPSTMTGQIDQNGVSVHAGGGIDFGGHNFGKEEHVNIMLSGSQVGQAFTNSTGSFSTGSMSLPTTPGTYSYTFVGENSGITGSATITVTP